MHCGIIHISSPPFGVFILGDLGLPLTNPGCLHMPNLFDPPSLDTDLTLFQTLFSISFLPHRICVEYTTFDFEDLILIPKVYGHMNWPDFCYAHHLWQYHASLDCHVSTWAPVQGDGRAPYMYYMIFFSILLKLIYTWNSNGLYHQISLINKFDFDLFRTSWERDQCRIRSWEKLSLRKNCICVATWFGMGSH